MNWLFVADQFPYPLAHGTWLRIYHLTRALCRAGDSVTLLAPAEEGEAGISAYNDIGVSVLTTTGGDYDDRGVFRFDRSLAEALASCAKTFDAVVLAHARALQYAECATAAGIVIADLIDDLVLEERRKARRDLHPLRLARRLRMVAQLKRYERTHAGSIYLATFVSDADADTFSRRNPDVRTAVVANGVDIDAFAPPADRPRSAEPTVVFLGNFVHPPNADAARFLLGKIAPRIRQAVPDASAVILGASPPADLNRLASAGDVITGWVDDVRPTLWDAGVVILPMRTGTGIKNKLLEAWAAGKAVVATPLACQGTPARDGEHLLIARTAAELADATTRLLKDERLRERLGQAGQSLVREQFTWDAAAGKLRQAATGAQ